MVRRLLNGLGLAVFRAVGRDRDRAPDTSRFGLGSRGSHAHSCRIEYVPITIGGRAQRPRLHIVHIAGCGCAIIDVADVHDGPVLACLH